MPVEITATGSDANVLQQVASDGGHPVTHQGSNRNRIEQVAADAGLGAVPWLSDAGAIVWLADNLAGAIACVYALAAELQELSSIGFDGRLALSDGDQTGSYALQGLTNTDYEAAMAPAGVSDFSGARLDIQDGRAIELQCLAPVYVGPGVINFVCQFVVAGPAIGAVVRLSILRDAWYLYLDDVQVDADTFANRPYPQAVGVVMAGGNLVLRHGGGNYGGSAFPGGEVMLMASVEEKSSGANYFDPEDAGKIAAIRVETDAKKYMGSYEAGTTDTCGGVIAA